MRYRRSVDVVDHYAWALWLATPVVATALAAAWVWWRGRAPKLPGPKRAIAEHRAYLEALTRHTVDSKASHKVAEPRRSPSVTTEARSTVTR